MVRKRDDGLIDFLSSRNEHGHLASDVCGFYYQDPISTPCRQTQSDNHTLSQTGAD